MRISDFIRNKLDSRLSEKGCLVVYDPDRRYKGIVQGMAAPGCLVIDATDSIIESRERAMDAVCRPSNSQTKASQVLVYVPSPAPNSDQAKWNDPFAALAAAGRRFPDSDADDYSALCQSAKPEHKAKIVEVFASGVPDFATIDAIGGGPGWPRLQALLGVESATEILTGLLSPGESQECKMKEDDRWISEAKAFSANLLGFSAKTKSRNWAAIAEELWRFVLFSEFVYDLPGTVPSALANVPRARPDATELVNRVCEVLRSSENHQKSYLEHASAVARDLDLERQTMNVQDFGVLDTFAFEERSFLAAFVKSVLDDDWAKARKIAEQRRNSLWVKQTDRQIAWTIADRGLRLLLRAEDVERDLADKSSSLADLLHFYAATAYQLDLENRDFEQSVADALGDIDGIDPLVDIARQRFRCVVEKMQRRFIKLVSAESWPVSGSLRATRLFDELVRPLLESRTRRVAYFMVDALRYELGAALAKQISADYKCALRPVCAQLPTITQVGMAALLPGADGAIVLKRSGETLETFIGEAKVLVPADRVAFLQRIYGDNCDMIDLDDLLSISGTKKRIPIPDKVRLLVVKTTEIDSQGEMAVAGVLSAIPKVLAKLVASLARLRKLGFHEAIISADHGFMLFGDRGPGETVKIPPGNWLKVKDRCCLGGGGATEGVAVFQKKQVGIAGDFDSYAVPQTFATFAKRVPYFHEGLSLQECVIPALHIQLGQPEEQRLSQIEVQIRYRGETTGTVTTLRPVLEVSLFGADFFEAEDVVFRIEARAKLPGGARDVVVGDPASCNEVDSATGLVRMKPGQAAKIPIRLTEGVDGPFEVHAVNPETDVLLGAPLKLRARIMT